MFLSKSRLRGKKSKRNLIFLVIQLHILILLLSGILLMMFNFQNKPMPFFSILFNSSKNSVPERKAQILIPKGQEKEQKTSTNPSSNP